MYVWVFLFSILKTSIHLLWNCSLLTTFNFLRVWRHTLWILWNQDKIPNLSNFVISFQAISHLYAWHLILSQLIPQTKNLSLSHLRIKLQLPNSFRTPLTLYIGMDSIKAVTKDGKVVLLSYEDQELRDFLLCQVGVRNYEKIIFLLM